jgi:hypothetical protein
MHKKEIILFHLALFHIKQLLETGFAGFFQAYEELGVLPTHIYRMKERTKKQFCLFASGFWKCLEGWKIF